MTNNVTKAIKSYSLDPNIQKICIMLNPITPMIYGQLKIHKKDFPFRPIVSGIGGPTHALSKLHTKTICHFSDPIFSYSSHFIKQTKNMNLDENEIMVIFDLISLFIKIHVPKDIDLIYNLVDFKMLNLIKIFLSTTFFNYNVVFYEKTKGKSMGSSIPPVAANIFMEQFETLSLETFHLKRKF